MPRSPLITRISHGLYRRYDAGALVQGEPLERARPREGRVRLDDAEIDEAVRRYLGARDPGSRYTSFDYCFNHFQRHRAEVKVWGAPMGMEISCLQLGFYLASWGMLRGSAELLQRSVRHLVPLVETIADTPPALWDVDLDSYDQAGVDLVYRTAGDIRDALRPLRASDILVTKVMLGVFGCVPAFDTYFKKGFGVSNFAGVRWNRWVTSIGRTLLGSTGCDSPLSTSQLGSQPPAFTPGPRSSTWSSSSKVVTPTCRERRPR